MQSFLLTEKERKEKKKERERERKEREKESGRKAELFQIESRNHAKK